MKINEKTIFVVKLQGDEMPHCFNNEEWKAAAHETTNIVAEEAGHWYRFGEFPKDYYGVFILDDLLKIIRENNFCMPGTSTMSLPSGKTLTCVCALERSGGYDGYIYVTTFAQYMSPFDWASFEALEKAFQSYF